MTNRATNRITGKVYVLGDNIDTDQIIPACHLVYSLRDPQERKLYGKYALSGLPKDQYPQPFSTEEGVSDFAIIVAGRNFGSGSSREQAPACLAVAGVKVVVAETFARIFYRNSVNGGFLLPVEMEARQDLSALALRTGDVVTVDLENWTLSKQGQPDQVIQLRDFGDLGEIVNAGGIFGLRASHVASVASASA